MQIISIKSADGGGAVRITALSADGERLSFYLLKSSYDSLSLATGEHDDSFIDTLTHLDAVASAVKAGRRTLAYGANSAKALRTKLLRKGFSPSVVSPAIDILVRESGMDESADAMRLCELALGKNLGASRIILYLKNRGYTDDSLTEVKKYLSEIDFSVLCRRSLEKKYRVFPSDEGERQKCIAYLLRQGFTYADIRRALCNE